ncbi:MAG: hypothetical protein ACRD3W_08470, partial [Terriglobales bacterium]
VPTAIGLPGDEVGVKPGVPNDARPVAPTAGVAATTPQIGTARQPGKEVVHEQREEDFFKAYLAGKAQPRIAAYHAVPALLARSEKGREAFQDCWNKYVSPGFIVSTEQKPELLDRYFGVGPSLAERVLWE